MTYHDSGGLTLVDIDMVDYFKPITLDDDPEYRADLLAKVKSWLSSNPSQPDDPPDMIVARAIHYRALVALLASDGPSEVTYESVRDRILETTRVSKEVIANALKLLEDEWAKAAARFE